MVIRGSYMALDFSTPGAIFLFLFLIGVLNLCFKLAARGLLSALLFAFVLIGAYAYAFWPFDEIDPHSPGLIFSTFVVITALLNVKVVQDGAGLALNRSELILVYLMLLIVSALCTMGLSEQLLPMLTALFYYASPENKWMEKLLPHVPKHHILVDDGNNNRSFYEGISQAGHSIPFSAWVEPLVWWGIFLLALYVAMVCTAVILRRQWVERERLAYPITQVPLAMVRGEDPGQLVNGFFKSRAMWAGCSIPLIVGSLTALHRYDPAFSPLQLTWIVPFFSTHTLQLHITFMILGFSYLINTHVAVGIWFFYLLLKIEKAILPAIGLQSEQHIVFGVSDSPFSGLPRGRGSDDSGRVRNVERPGTSQECRAESTWQGTSYRRWGRDLLLPQCCDRGCRGRPSDGGLAVGLGDSVVDLAGICGGCNADFYRHYPRRGRSRTGCCANPYDRPRSADSGVGFPTGGPDRRVQFIHGLYVEWQSPGIRHGHLRQWTKASRRDGPPKPALCVLEYYLGSANWQSGRVLDDLPHDLQVRWNQSK